MTNNDFLPFTRPSIDEATIAGVAEVLRSGWITTGPMVRKFEESLSACVGNRRVRSFNSGTAALEIGLHVAGIRPGDEVITTPLSWVATSNVILSVGAKPVFVDVDPVTRNIDLNRIEAAITPATRALMPVYLAGLPVDMDKLYTIAKKHGLRVIEDAAQALGSRWRGQRIGEIGDLVAFSFQANKNLTCAEGGALVVNSAAEGLICEKYRLQGVVRQPDGEMECDVLGGKSNLTDIAARIALGQLPLIESVIERRKTLARRYFELWDRALDCEMPVEDFENSNWHMFQVVLPNRIKRPDFINRMKERGIGIGVHYPPIHLFALYRKLGFREGQYPHAERIGRQIATLPLFPAMNDTDVERVCDAARQVMA
ncbi:MAG: DegT/DnrJ/EryC1/StrS family aminotransferase [Burkholderiales bacterium]